MDGVAAEVDTMIVMVIKGKILMSERKVLKGRRIVVKV